MNKKTVSGIMLTLLFTSMLTLAFNIQPVKTETSTENNQPPVASFTYSPTDPFVKIPVEFDASASYDPDGNITWYKWDFGKGYTVGTYHTPSGTTYTDPGNYTVTLTVTDNEGATDTETSTLTVRAPINPQEGEVTLNPIDDTYTDASNPDENYGDQTTLYVSNITERIAWLKFDLGAVPDGAVVDHARLKLYCSLTTETYNVCAHPCSDNSWTESTLTYSNMPSFNASQFILSSYMFSYGGWGDWNVADAVREAVDGIHGGPDIVTIVISGIPKGKITQQHLQYEDAYISFHSKEGLYVPELTVHWIGTDAPEDPTPPVISIVSPENKTYSVEDVPLTFTVSESTSWIGYSLDEQANVTITGNRTLSELSDGLHSLIVYARDMAGNTGASEMVHFSIETQKAEPPQLWIIGLVAVVVIGIAIGAVFLWKRRK